MRDAQWRPWRVPRAKRVSQLWALDDAYVVKWKRSGLNFKQTGGDAACLGGSVVELAEFSCACPIFRREKFAEPTWCDSSEKNYHLHTFPSLV